MLGPKIQSHREQRGLSLRALAELTGITASFLSQVERGQANPSLNSLQIIADTLEIPLFYLLLDDGEDGHLVRRTDRQPLSGSGMAVELRSPNASRKIAVRLIQGQPDERYSPAKSQADQICLYVIAGSLQVELAQASYTLEAEDSITFKGQDFRNLTIIGDQSARYLSFSTPPAPDKR